METEPWVEKGEGGKGLYSNSKKFLIGIEEGQSGSSEDVFGCG